MYPEPGNPADGVARENFRSVDINANSSGNHAAFKSNVPTLAGVARLVEREEGKRLDRKQYIMYEVLACTFLLDLVCNHNIDGSSAPER